MIFFVYDSVSADPDSARRTICSGWRVLALSLQWGARHVRTAFSRRAYLPLLNSSMGVAGYRLSLALVSRCASASERDVLDVSLGTSTLLSRSCAMWSNYSDQEKSRLRACRERSCRVSTALAIGAWQRRVRSSSRADLIPPWMRPHHTARRSE
jgi:hypothetical protein